MLMGGKFCSLWCFVPSWKFVEGLVCWNLALFWKLDTSSLFSFNWYLVSFYLACVNGYLMPCCILIDIPQVIVFHLLSYYHLIPCILVSYQLCVELILESLEHAYLLYIASFACFLSLTRYIWETPPFHKLAKVCMKLNFISICTYLCGVCPMYYWLSNSLVPMSLGTILFVCCSRNNWRCIGCSTQL